MPTVLITGANRGLGLEFARQYAAEGWRVHACCRHPDKAAELKAVEGEVVSHKLDVTDGLQVGSLSRGLADEAIDLLINNAGVYEEHRSFEDTDVDEWLEVLKINTLAPFRMARRFADHLARSGLKTLVNVSSGLGSIAMNDGGGSYPYRSSKAALNMVVKGLSVDLAGRGIIVVAFAPGWVETDMGGAGAELTPEVSIGALRQSIAALTQADSGRFMNRHGEDLPW
jgi:NAD(P)-dependent dehydrogenase (short-subunit alcohol dehydrogenase family)